MRLALREASRALEHDDIPVGAIVVHDGEVIGAGHNERELRADPTAHAEMIALRAAAQAAGELARARLGALRHARAVRHVRRGDRARPGAAGGVRHHRSQGRGRRQRARRPGRAAAQPPAPGRVRACWPRSAATCCARSSPPGADRRRVRTRNADRRNVVRQAGAECSNLLSAAPRRGGRAVECAGLENRYGLSVHRGFESPPLRSQTPARTVSSLARLGHVSASGGQIASGAARQPAQRRASLRKGIAQWRRLTPTGRMPPVES